MCKIAGNERNTNICSGVQSDHFHLAWCQLVPSQVSPVVPPCSLLLLSIMQSVWPSHQPTTVTAQPTLRSHPGGISGQFGILTGYSFQLQNQEYLRNHLESHKNFLHISTYKICRNRLKHFSSAFHLLEMGYFLY